jgi:hypothetical protein
MEIEEARSILAKYLTGERCSPEELQEACKTANSDRGYLQFLNAEFGLADNEVDLHEVFRANADEFCELPKEERQRKFPELIEHLWRCASCLAVYWQIAPIWKQGLPTKVSANVKHLVEGLNLVWNRSAGLVQKGIPIPPVELPTVAAIAAGDQEKTQPTRWEFVDEDTGVSIEVTAKLDPKEGLAVFIEASGEMSGEPYLEMVPVNSEEVLVAGPLPIFTANPIYLPSGEYLLKVRGTTASDSLEWVIPLAFSKES